MTVGKVVQHYQHSIDQETGYCVKCGQSLVVIQKRTRWVGNTVVPACINSDTVVAISHLVRK